jgi:hypothetical protein
MLLAQDRGLTRGFAVQKPIRAVGVEAQDPSHAPSAGPRRRFEPPRCGCPRHRSPPEPEVFGFAGHPWPNAPGSSGEWHRNQIGAPPVSTQQTSSFAMLNHISGALKLRRVILVGTWYKGVVTRSPILTVPIHQSLFRGLFGSADVLIGCVSFTAARSGTWGTRWPGRDGITGAMAAPPFMAMPPVVGEQELRQDDGRDPRLGSTKQRPAGCGSPFPAPARRS